MQKNKRQKILKATRRRATNNIHGTPLRLSADFLVETLQARRHDIFKGMKGRNPQPTIPSKALVQIWQRNRKLYTQAKAKNSVPSSQLYSKLQRNFSKWKRPKPEIKLRMGKPTGKGKLQNTE